MMYICIHQGNRALYYPGVIIEIGYSNSWKKLHQDMQLGAMQGQRGTFEFNKTEDLFLCDSYLIPCKPYPKGLPPPVLERAALAQL